MSMKNNVQNNVQHVFLIGAKSLGAYGGYETFVDKLTEYHQGNFDIQYHVACKANGDGCMDESMLPGVQRVSDLEFLYHNARCLKIPVPNIGPAQAIYYDIKALQLSIKYIKQHKIEHPIIYIMACRIGPFIKKDYKAIHKLGGYLYVNPDGHEWMRAKWNRLIRRYWKFSERLMVKYCDKVVCDSVNIENYIHESYNGRGVHGTNPDTTFIAYGAETRKSSITNQDSTLLSWYAEHGIRAGNYYLVVGRFVPENNYEIMLREFMKSDTKKDFVLITNVNDKFLAQLEERLHYKKDGRIKFVGTVYNRELLMKIRENAYAYLHGHEVGGTNPSLLEALSSTPLNLLLKVGFNEEVAGDTALYWTKDSDNLANLINKVETMKEEEILDYGKKAKARIQDAYSWDFIAGQYETLFLEGK